jgi:hypothetical protein
MRLGRSGRGATVQAGFVDRRKRFRWIREVLGVFSAVLISYPHSYPISIPRG